LAFVTKRLFSSGVQPAFSAAVNPEELNIVDNNSTETETDIAASDPTDAPVIIPTPIEVPEEVVDENVEFVVVEEMPVFRNGNADLMRYLSENIKYPTVSAEQGVQGRVVVQFVVGVHGEILNPVVVKSVDPYLDTHNELHHYPTLNSLLGTDGRIFDVFTQIPHQISITVTKYRHLFHHHKFHIFIHYFFGYFNRGRYNYRSIRRV
jgi:hypothetical protein